MALALFALIPLAATAAAVALARTLDGAIEAARIPTELELALRRFNAQMVELMEAWALSLVPAVRRATAQLREFGLLLDPPRPLSRADRAVVRGCELFVRAATLGRR